MDVAAAWRLNVRARWRSALAAAHYNNHNNDNINDNNDEYVSVPLLNERRVFAFKVQANFKICSRFLPFSLLLRQFSRVKIPVSAALYQLAHIVLLSGDRQRSFLPYPSHAVFIANTFR